MDTDSKRLEPIAVDRSSPLFPSSSSSCGWATNFYACSLARDIVPLARPLDCFRSLNVERLRSLVNSLVIANFSRGIYGNCASFCAIYAWGKKRGEGEEEILGKMLNFQEITAETDNRNTKQRKNGFNDVVKQRDGARCFRQLVKPRRNAEVALRITIDRVFFFSSVRKNRCFSTVETKLSLACFIHKS